VRLAALTSTSSEAPKWDGEKTPGETFTAAIDVDEGTWISLDVSPDGGRIVFDLLGDLYTLPIEGGEAKPLTDGVAWDIQPRYSPDGEWIAFVSDRDGMDNVWLIRPDGTGLRQVTREKEHEIASPAWAPDGMFIAVRKHFTSERSLGAGEVWIYHRSGGDGLMATKRPNEQKDLGEPSFSPDGRYLYFSQDTTAGALFEYNKNPHAGIYQVKRLDRTNGRVDVLIGGAGGAASPLPSRDGKRVAFVRRAGLSTGLFSHDLTSGREDLLFDALDRDMQETWATQGVYPGYAFTPDDRSIVFWAGGKLRKLDVDTRQAAVIPFHVSTSRKMWRAIRFPVEAHPARMRARMLRFITASPDGTRVVFSALGHLYVRPIGGGVPRRLTNDEGVFEMHPSFSRDGSSVVYTTWSDEDLGAVRVASVGDGRSRTITREPGHYADPVFSPDGSTVVYRRLGSDVLRPRLYVRDPGLYAVSAAGGTGKLVVREGDRPQFGASSERVYYVTRKGEGEATRTLLESIEIDGSDPITHAKSALGSEIVLSPDGRHVAFRETYEAYVAPFVATGSPIEIGPNAKSIPIIRVSKESGAHLHFSGDGRRLHWSMGPELQSIDLEPAFAELEGDPSKKPKVPESGVDLSFEVDTDLPRGTLALTGGRIVTMKGAEVIDGGVVVIEGNRIAAVGASGLVPIPRGARVVDVRGATIIPGLVDVHAHGPYGSDDIIPKTSWALYASLAFGVTTIHDPSADTPTVFAASELQRSGAIVGPRIFSTGTILYGARLPAKAEVSSLDDARNHIRRMKASGAFTVKSYRQRRRSQRQQLLAAAREIGMMVVPEGGSIFHHDMSMIVDGHTGIEHAIPVASVYDDVLQLWSKSDVGYTPTTGVAYGGIWGENYWYQHTDVFAHPRLTRFVPPFLLEARARRRMMASEGDWNHVRVARVSKKLSDAGVRVNLGAHGQREGLAAHWELWMMVQGGLTPHEALRIGTVNGARYIGLDRDLGTIEAGKLADLAVIDGDVLADIRASENVRYTVVNGRLFDAMTMNELYPMERARPRFYFE
jgi:imidazolonepropionase-like amidohydrolase/Tol biopolymer transport system component